MIWCRFQKDASIAYGMVEGDTIIAVEGDPFGQHARTSTGPRRRGPRRPG